MFTDTVTISFIAGKGGNGLVSWRREKYLPKGGPAGGDGGNGGSVIIRASNHLLSLEDYRHTKQIKAENGQAGGSSNKTGRNGKDIVIKVPPGTLIKDFNTGEVLHDLTEHNQEIVICQGGIGGKGNTHFKTPTNQAPNIATPGTAGEEKRLILELKIIADVGLVGMPNAGKSTFISSVAKIPVKIAPYPFTTMRPNIGMVEFSDFSRIYIADIPGIIEDAHQNRGLGLSFLKHIERTELLIYILDISGIERQDPMKDFQILENELLSYDPTLKEKPFLVVLNKADICENEEIIEKFKNEYPYDPSTLFVISALEKEGLTPLMKKAKQLCQRNKIRYL
ncbi:MAG TPA: GTPase ObgE [Chlamydiales bacterium]|nr:GTPase ObgE [Chlamydiales bacterium]